MEPWYVSPKGNEMRFCYHCGSELVLVKVHDQSYHDYKTGERIEQYKGDVMCPRRIGFLAWITNPQDFSSRDSYVSSFYVHRGSGVYPIREWSEEQARELSTQAESRLMIRSELASWDETFKRKYSR